MSVLFLVDGHPFFSFCLHGLVWAAIRRKWSGSSKANKKEVLEISTKRSQQERQRFILKRIDQLLRKHGEWRGWQQ